MLQGLLDNLNELSAAGGKTLPGLSTGLSAVDGKISGLNKSDLLLLAARPGNKGKVIVCILPDGADRYLSTPLFENA